MNNNNTKPPSPTLPYDYTRCTNSECPNSNICMRFQASLDTTHHPWLSYSFLEPDESGCCLYFIRKFY